MLVCTAILSVLAVLCNSAVIPETGNELYPLEVTLSVYSGAEEPSWVVYPDNPVYQVLYTRLQNHGTTSLPSLLGYRGFLVGETDENDVLSSTTIAAGSNPELEQLLLFTGLSSADSSTAELVEDILSSETFGNNPCQSSTTPSLSPSTASTDTVSPDGSEGHTDIHVPSTLSVSVPPSTTSSSATSSTSTTTVSTSSTQSSLQTELPTLTPGTQTETQPSSSPTTTSTSLSTSTSTSTTPLSTMPSSSPSSSSTSLSSESTSTDPTSPTSSPTGPSSTGSTSPTSSPTDSSSTGSISSTSSPTDSSSTGSTSPTSSPTESSSTDPTSPTSSLSTLSSSQPTSPTEPSSTTYPPTSSTSTTPSSPPTPTPSATPTPSTTPEPCKCPKYEPDKWNKDILVRINNNCYNYATDSKTGTYAQPGRGSGQIYTGLTGPEVRDAAVRDGLKVLADPGGGDFPETEDCLVALVIWEGRDFHWYRRDTNGKWSHKPDITPATNKDNSGKEITDPRLADLGRYKFVTFMSYCPGKITVNK